MGAAGSTLKGEEYSKRADASKQLADKLLTLFFSKTDFRDLMSLSSLTGCSSYVFTTSEALQKLFTTIQVYPKLGKKGEILFAPVSQLAPGLIASKESDQEKRKAMEERNIICMDVAYYYVRIFQIYASLALTVLDASPLRKRRASLGSGTGKSQKAVFMGGGGTQKGGAINKKSTIYSQLRNLPLYAPFAEMDSLQEAFDIRGVTTQYLYIKTKGTFSIEWNFEALRRDEPVRCYYEYRSVQVEVPFQMVPGADDSRLVLLVENTPLIEFSKVSGPRPWVFRCINDNIDTTNIEAFKSCIDGFFLPKVESQTAVGAVRGPTGYTGYTGATSATSGYRPSIGSVPSGASSFQSFDDIKKLFDKRYKGEEFPKAYCIARAMTLLNPIFDSEKIDKSQPSYSEICQQKYEFELIDAMPRADKTPAANLYLKSLVSLYYDDYTVKGNTVTFIQTETGRSSLRDASKKLALLYNINDNKETFIESTQRFRHFGICPPGQGRTIQILKKEFANKLQKEVITPMLVFQETHTKKVNDLLKKMFSIDAKGELRFQPELRNGGKAAVTQFSREAAALLLNYYLKSEAYYIKGVLMFEDKANAGSFTFI